IGAGRGVEIALTIEGFTIQNGEADYGGGISIASGDSLDLNLINDNISGNINQEEYKYIELSFCPTDFICNSEQIG
ncbi:MAG: hypothetical protein KAR17_05275, partial [Cyclobacteriaceae bacterium]|nr:hypothetical protein [Cyclobacteriaceae bacterium]